MLLVNEFSQALQSLDRLEAEKILMGSRDDCTPLQCVESLVIPALLHIGYGWEKGDVSLAQVYMSGRICEELVDKILPLPTQLANRNPRWQSPCWMTIICLVSALFTLYCALVVLIY